MGHGHGGHGEEPEVPQGATEGWRVTHGPDSSVFEHPVHPKVELRDPIRKYWRGGLETRLGNPISEAQSTELGGRRLAFVLFENGALYMDADKNEFFEVHRETQEILDRLQAGIGRWDMPFEEGVVGVHLALLHTHEVLLFTYDSAVPNKWFPTDMGEWSLLDLRTGRQKGELSLLDLPDPDDPDLPDRPQYVKRFMTERNLFCAGQSLLGDGRLVVVGGERETPRGPAPEHKATGLNQKSVYVFDPERKDWVTRRDLEKGRWYPTVVTVRANTAVAVGGDDFPAPKVQHANPTAEYVDADGTTRSALLPFGPSFKPYDAEDRQDIETEGNTTSQYPFVFLLPPRGEILVHFRQTSYVLPPDTFDFGAAQKPLQEEGRDRTTGVYGTAVMLPLRPTDDPPYRARIMVMGGPFDRRGPSASILDTGARPLEWKPTAPMSETRGFCDSVLLPDGKVLLVNGSGIGKLYPNRRPELYDPKTGSWWPLPLAEARTPRVYHSTALLLPDATVLTAGHDRVLNPDKKDRRELERFSPPYLFAGPRPVNRWTPGEVAYDSKFEIAADDVARIASVALIRTGSCTHSFNPDQRFIELQITRRLESRRWVVGSSKPGGLYESFHAEGLELRAPPDIFVAPPGYYLLFLVSDKGVPSIAPFVRLVSRQRVWILVERVISSVLRMVLDAVFRPPPGR